MKGNIIGRTAMVALAVLFTSPTPMLADSFVWDNTCGDSLWYTVCSGSACGPTQTWLRNNWGRLACSPGQPPFPAASDDVHIGALARMPWQSSAAVRNVLIPIGGDLQVGDGGHLTLHGNSLEIDGRLRLHYGGLGGPGTLTLAGDASLTGDGVLETDTAAVIDGAGPLHVSPTQMIRGNGATIRVALDNAGVVACDVPGTNSALRDAPKNNTGIIRATNGSALLVSVSIDQSGGGVLHADNGAFHLQNGTAISGGTLETVNGGIIWVDYQTATVTDIVNTGDLRVGNGGMLIVNGTALDNQGVIRVYYAGYAGNGTVRFDAPVGLLGNGEIELTGASLNGSPFTQAASHTIRGSNGTINAGFENLGVIRAEGAGGALSLQTDPKINRGDIVVMSGAHLNVSTTVTQLGAGRIFADGGAVHLNTGTTVAGGTLETANGGIMWVDYQTATVADVTNRGDLRVGNGGQIISTSGTLTNHGTITTYYSGWAGCGTLRLDADLRIEGTGALQLVCSGVVSPSGRTLTNGPGHTISGTSPINVVLVNEGILAPGNSIGTLPVNAAFVQASTGQLRVELGGVGSNDQLAVAGSAALAGELRIIPVSGFQPQPGQQFVVLTSAGLTGEFAPITGSGRYSANYDNNRVTITVLYPPADMNCDTFVGPPDIEAFILALLDPSAYQAQFPLCNRFNADMNGDGFVNGADIQGFIRVIISP